LVDDEPGPAGEGGVVTAVRILVVEDSDDDAKLAMRILRKDGFQPTYRRVQDVQALKAAFDQERWDAVLSDFRLPGFNGVEALEIFRATGLDIPFIFFSGTIGEETAVAAMKAGASDYVMKQDMARLAPALKRELSQAAIRSEHRKGQIDLGASRDRYVDLYDFAPVGYLTLSAEGLIAQVNLTGAEMLGEDRRHLLRANFATFVLPTDADGWRQHFAHALRSGDKQRFEMGFRSRKGNCVYVQLDCMSIWEEAGPTVRVAMTDVTDRREAEAALRKIEAQLRDVQKMESLGTLAGGIAHDFNNILGAILGNVALALEDVGPRHAALVSLFEIQKASARARNLVQQILTFSRQEAQELIPQSLRPVVEETYKLLRATLPAGVELDVDVADEPLYVLADATQVQQVLMNLCTNAWQALKEGRGRISVGLAAAVLDADKRQHLGSLPPGAYAHLWVSDTGTGMDADTRERIFEPFFTTKPLGQGTGLGLSVVHGILNGHHGAIAVDSEVGRGSTFHLYFPVAESNVPVVSVGADAAVLSPPRGRGERVLYVDDDETMRILVERLLERSGYRVTSYESARDAIEAVREHPEAFDLVVTDFNMPEVSGLEVVRELALIRPGLPVVISSGYVTRRLRDEASLAGVRGVLEKQNTFEELSRLVGSILSEEAGSVR
jgi:PAS domain S-box-containing protein